MAAPSYSSVEVKVGIFVAFCLAIFAAMLIIYGKVAPVWRGRQPLYVAFENAGSLRSDAPVRYNGVEVGRVKWMRLLHLNDENLERLPRLTRRDLDNLPLRLEPLKRALRDTPDEDFDAKCRAALKDHTMIELCLEVLQEGDVKRYRMDDHVRIVSTVFGDTAVEIISGSGAVNTLDSPRLILGNSGDFFSNLARSMGDVKDILSSVTDVVGAPERRSFERAQSRFAPINERLDKIAALADQRSEMTTQRLDAVSAEIKKTLADAGDTLESIEPRAKKTFDNAKTSLTALQERVTVAQSEASAAFKELSADTKAVRADVRQITDRSKPDFEAMKASLREVYDDFGGLSARMDGMRATTGWFMTESEPDIARLKEAIANSLANFQNVKDAANENKDLMLSKSDVGEYEYNTTLDIYRRMTFATRRMREAGAQLQDVCRALPDNPHPGKLSEEADRTSEKLAALRQSLELPRIVVEKMLLPDFQRKKTAWPAEIRN